MAIYPEITDRAVVITGAAAGIGEAAAIAFYKQGAHIFFLDIDQKKLGISPQIVRRINENGIDPFLMGSAQMGAFIAADYQRMGKLIKDVGIHGE